MAYLQGLFLCVNVANPQDVAKLVQAAQLVLSSQDGTGSLGLAALVQLIAVICLSISASIHSTCR